MTTERHAEAALLAERELQRANLHRLFMQAPAAIAILRGPDYVFELANARYERMVGREGLAGKPLRTALPELATQGFCAESERRYAQADLEFAQELARRAAVAVDNARLYESAKNARAMAELSNRAKDDFLATVSHELRTPLNAMLGWTRLLRTGDLNEEKKVRALETIERNAVTQAQLIQDLLDVSRIMSGKFRLDVQSVELTDIVQQAIDALRLASEAKGIRTVTRLDSNAGPIMGDSNRLQQVVRS